MIAKYGSVEAGKDFMRQMQKKSRVNYKGTGGFAAMDKDKLKEVQRKAQIAHYGYVKSEEAAQSKNTPKSEQEPEEKTS